MAKIFSLWLAAEPEEQAAAAASDAANGVDQSPAKPAPAAKLHVSAATQSPGRAEATEPAAASGAAADVIAEALTPSKAAISREPVTAADDEPEAGQPGSQARADDAGGVSEEAESGDEGPQSNAGDFRTVDAVRQEVVLSGAERGDGTAAAAAAEGGIGAVSKGDAEEASSGETSAEIGDRSAPPAEARTADSAPGGLAAEQDEDVDKADDDDVLDGMTALADDSNAVFITSFTDGGYADWEVSADSEMQFGESTRTPGLF